MIDLRSDTVTKPTSEMRQAALEAMVGDDVYEEDPTVNELEALAANKLGKEKALFVPSGTQGNQIAVLTHCVPGQEIILEADSHIFYYEGATISAFAGVQPRPIKGKQGAMDPAEVKAAIREDDIHQPETGLICLENTHNRAGGAIVSLQNMRDIHAIAKEARIPVHLDGARIFNSSVATGISVKDYASYTDSVQFCLSKGLGAPVGSIIAGTEEFITRARKWRKRLGGGMRQAGVIAAPGIIALNTMVDRLAEDHAKARHLANRLEDIGIQVINEVETNIVLVNTESIGHTAFEFIEQLKEKEILATTFGPTTVRFTTHYDVINEDINNVIKQIKSIIDRSKELDESL